MMMKQHVTGAAALLLASALALSAFTPALAAEVPAENGSGTAVERSLETRGGHGRHGGKHHTETAEPESAIGKDVAKAAALSDAGLGEEQVEKLHARYSTKGDSPVYKVRFVSGDTAYSYQIDPETGIVLDKQTGSAQELPSRHSGESGEKVKTKTKAQEPEDAIGKDAAKQAALSAAGLSADQVTKLKARYSESGETPAYRVSFRYEGSKYSYRIDPQTGAVLEQNSETLSA